MIFFSPFTQDIWQLSKRSCDQSSAMKTLSSGWNAKTSSQPQRMTFPGKLSGSISGSSSLQPAERSVCRGWRFADQRQETGLHPDATTLWVSSYLTDIMCHVGRKWHIQRNQRITGRKFQPACCTYMCLKCRCSEGRINTPDSKCGAHFVTSVSRNWVNSIQRATFTTQPRFSFVFPSVTEYFSVFELELERFFVPSRRTSSQ